LYICVKEMELKINLLNSCDLLVLCHTINTKAKQ
jgi:hypothetical protein